MKSRLHSWLLRLVLLCVGAAALPSCVGPGYGYYGDGYYYRDYHRGRHHHYRDRDYDHGRRHHHRSHHDRD